jgi:P-type conjugative transfer protein TrbJ
MGRGFHSHVLRIAKGESRMIRRRILLALVSGTIGIVTVPWLFRPAVAFPVFDASNYAENTLTAARTLAQINNQIQSLQNQARNLQSLNYSSLPQLISTLQQISTLMNQAQGITFNLNQTNTLFQQQYPLQYGTAVSSNQLVVDARTRWQNSMSAYQETLGVQSQIVQNVQADAPVLNKLVTSSQGSVGSLQAQQATNQLLALSTKQQMQIQNLMAAQYRAEALEQARKTESQQQGKVQTDKFLGNSGQF